MCLVEDIESTSLLTDYIMLCSYITIANHPGRKDKRTKDKDRDYGRQRKKKKKEKNMQLARSFSTLFFIVFLNNLHATFNKKKCPCRTQKYTINSFGLANSVQKMFEIKISNFINNEKFSRLFVHQRMNK